MLSFAITVPAQEKRQGRTMLLRTDPCALWVAEFPDGSPAWVYNGDDFARVHELVERHLAYLRRIAQDTKFERRKSRTQRNMINGSRDRRCQKHHARIKTFLHQVTSHLASYCCRHGVAEIFYDDAVKSWLPKFPWHQLETILRGKLELLGITLTSGGAQEESVA
jgi:transposase